MGTDKGKGGGTKRLEQRGRARVIWGMEAGQFFALDEAEAAKRGEALLALWAEARGDWDRAHALAQQAADERAGSWVHAYLHRVEGDEGNAGYWYARAGRRSPGRGVSFAQERAEIAAALLAAEGGASR